jgi:hypothetical protein
MNSDITKTKPAVCLTDLPGTTPLCGTLWLDSPPLQTTDRALFALVPGACPECAKAGHVTIAPDLVAAAYEACAKMAEGYGPVSLLIATDIRAAARETREELRRNGFSEEAIASLRAFPQRE